MSAGEDIEKAHKLSAQACFFLVTLIVKRRGNREFLENALERLEAAADLIRSLLTAHDPRSRVGVQPKIGDES